MRALRFLESRIPAPHGPFVRYASAVAAAVFTALVQWVLLPEPAIAPFVFFFFAIALVAWVAGRGPGVLAVLLSALLANWLFLKPYGKLSLTIPDVTATLLFLVGAGAVALICAEFREALLESQRTAAQLREQAFLLERSTEAARDSEARLQTLADNIAQLAWMADEKGGVFWYNRRWFHYTGATLDEMQGSGWQKVLHPDDVERVVGKIRRCFETGDAWEDLFPLRAKDGTYRWFLTRAVPVRGAHGKVVRWFGTHTDITEQRNAQQALRESEAELRDANERLQEADLRKNEFLGVLSHELRNPLSPIRNSLYLLSRAAPGSEQGRRSLAIIERQVHQLTRLVDDLLDVTRIARGKIRLQRERIDLRALATQVSDDYYDLFEKGGLELEVVVGDEPLFVSADRTRLTQIIGNLLHNAVKFTPQGSRTTLSLRKADEWSAAISVRDGGHGIAPDVMAHLFEPFAQAEKTLERSAGGLGLGLALVKGLSELHGGSVSAHNTGPGKGAEFVVRLPLERRQTARLAVVKTGAAPASSLRVLVIEDNVDAAQSLKDALELNGHHVGVAYTGPEGLQLARASKPDVVLCDIGLPGMNGFDLAKAMRADRDLDSITLIALSGYALPEDVDQARVAGFDLHLAKPPDLVELERSMAQARSAMQTA